MTSCLEKGQAIPQINSNLYFVERTILLKFQKDRSTRTKVIEWKPLYLQTDDHGTQHHDIRWLGRQGWREPQSMTVAGIKTRKNMKTNKKKLVTFCILYFCNVSVFWVIRPTTETLGLVQGSHWRPHNLVEWLHITQRWRYL